MVGTPDKSSDFVIFLHISDEEKTWDYQTKISKKIRLKLLSDHLPHGMTTFEAHRFALHHDRYKKKYSKL